MFRAWQPDHLVTKAFLVLLEHAAQCCDQHSLNNSLGKLHESVAFIKKNICTCIPRHLQATFCNKFLDKFYRPSRPAAHIRAVLEIIMDLMVDELGCVSPILAQLTPSDAPRLRGLKVLQLYAEDSGEKSSYISLENFWLRDVINLYFHKDCRDADLDIIAENCPDLEELCIADSKKVTDKGLIRLRKCSKLRNFHVYSCRRVTLNGINEVLAAHGKIHKLFTFSHNGGFASASHSKLVPYVYPNVHVLGIGIDCVESKNLRHLVKQFPNLNELRIFGHIEGDLKILGSLHDLTILDLTHACHIDWNNLKQLLEIVGENICELRANGNDGHCNSAVTQGDIDFVFQFCKNITVFEFSYWPDLGERKLVIPQFEKLKELACSVHPACPHPEPEIEIREMMKLETLEIEDFHVTKKMMESVLSDEANFPSLKNLMVVSEALE